MKAGIRVLSVLFLIGGLFIFFVAGEGKEASQPNKVTFGVVIDGKFTETDQGYIGGNEEAREEMGYLEGIGVIVILMGIGGFLGSFAVKSTEEMEN